MLQSVLPTALHPSALWAIIVSLGAGHLGCDRDEPSGALHTATNTTATTTSSAPANASGSPKASAKEAPASKLAGRYAGSYQAKRASVSLDKGVKDKAWEADDGKSASGKGEIQIVIAADGIVTGRVSGPLGPGILSGVAEADGITATLAPEEPGADGAMTGTLALEPAASDWKGTLRASSGSGEIAREAEVRLSPESK